MQLKAGLQLRSVVCETRVIVVRGDDDLDVRCGGAPMVTVEDSVDAPAELDPAFASGTFVGKRYADADGSLELLCVKGGNGTLAVGDTAVAVKEAKPLPASD